MIMDCGINRAEVLYIFSHITMTTLIPILVPLLAHYYSAATFVIVLIPRCHTLIHLHDTDLFRAIVQW
jgi:hypothetical protein